MLSFIIWTDKEDVLYLWFTIQENEVMELDMCHMLCGSFSFRRGKKESRVNLWQKDQSKLLNR